MREGMDEKPEGRNGRVRNAREPSEGLKKAEHGESLAGSFWVLARGARVGVGTVSFAPAGLALCFSQIPPAHAVGYILSPPRGLRTAIVLGRWELA